MFFPKFTSVISDISIISFIIANYFSLESEIMKMRSLHNTKQCKNLRSHHDYNTVQCVRRYNYCNISPDFGEVG